MIDQVWYCVLDEAGEVVGEKKLGMTRKAMKEVFAAIPRSRIAPETGMHAPWISRLLNELGHEAIVAHLPIVERRHRDGEPHGAPRIAGVRRPVPGRC